MTLKILLNFLMNLVKLPNTIVKWKGLDLVPYYGRYSDRSIAICLMDSRNEPYATVTAAYHDIKLNDDEVFIKTWSGLDDIVEPLRKSGIIGDLLRSYKMGYVTYEIYSLLKKPKDLVKK